MLAPNSYRWKNTAFIKSKIFCISLLIEKADEKKLVILEKENTSAYTLN
jgi:hypothetical protein